ncbi:hypothetical protein OG455_37945 [Kitasatospora sp. NBC_01287]|uniref:hypothetical protein n=1 Tax=Kitasatospora sp. NBC_01287 TaxID=2903573 RepID=UPI0022575B66|nr:hypothetical protein [Kitasatospora sp. NBC_01287]MCX4751220.1 hypothetical protein [Kitasatospora sp. NBC_01287]
MSRIRPVKPEAYQSETLAELTIYAERTFFGLATECDDRGRHKDHAAIIYGKLWVVRADQNPVDVEDHLMQMERSGLIHRYTGCDGKRYLHYITWDRHQKIDKPSLSRLPSCPHCAPERCGPCKGPCTQRVAASPAGSLGIGAPSSNTPRGFGEGSANTPGVLDRPIAPSSAPPTPALPAPAAAQDTLLDLGQEPVGGSNKTAGQTAFAEASAKALRDLPEPSAPGSRILDPGSSFPTGREAPDETVSANQLVAEYIATCAERPPGSVIAHLGKVVKTLLAEGIAAEHVRAGLRRFAEIQGHPSRLPSLVNDAMNARGAGLARPGFRPNVPAHQAWTNPVDAATAYAEEL